LQKFSDDLKKMKLEFELKKNGAHEQNPSTFSKLPTKPTPKLEFLGDKIESHIDPRMNDPEYTKKQLESLSNSHTHP
jgi:hypothetical protein